MSASRLKQSTKRHNANISMAYGCDKDNNTYCYRMTNGHKHLHRIILGRGWEHTPFDVTKLSCYEKGEESMTHRTGYHKQWLPWDELMPKVKELQAQGYETSIIAERLGIKKDTLWKRLYLNKKKAEKESLNCIGCFHMWGNPDYCLENCQDHSAYEPQTSEPEGGQPDPAQSEASAKAIITDEEIKETLDKCEVCGEESYPEGPQLNKFITADGKEVCYTCYFESEYSYLESEYSDKPSYTPTDNDYNDEPQRTTLTKAQYDAMVMNDDRLSALAIFCENQAVEQLRQDWAVSVFKHSRLSRERKLELIGMLLDWKVGA